jgi:hypothetical protein
VFRTLSAQHHCDDLSDNNEKSNYNARCGKYKTQPFRHHHNITTILSSGTRPIPNLLDIKSLQQFRIELFGTLYDDSLQYIGSYSHFNSALSERQCVKNQISIIFSVCKCFYVFSWRHRNSVARQLDSSDFNELLAN